MRYVSYFRHPHTKNEMKQYFASIENEMDIPIKIRGHRKPWNLPHAWDDIYRNQMRTWKRFRKTQWRA